jgi:hypothetical protein
MAVSERQQSADYEAPLVEPHRTDLKMWQERRQAARSDRRKYEPAWSMANSFLAGRQWVGWNTRTSRVVTLKNPDDRERHTINLITQYHQTVLGKLFVEDLRPDMLFTREDVEAQGISDHARLVSKYLWETELEADRALYRALHKMLTYGTAGLRCFYDPTKGPVIGEVPTVDGQPIYDPQQAYQAMSMAQEQGYQLPLEAVHEGQISWEPLSPYQMLPPPGVEYQDYFPWIIIERAMPVEYARQRYPLAPENLKGQPLETVDTMPRDPPALNVGGQTASGSRVKDHVLVATGYEMPTVEHPEGRVYTWTQDTPLEVNEQLPYKLKGKPHHGIGFFHYHNIDGRFWAQGVVEPLVGPQRQLNRSASQRIELKDRNMGRVYARKGTFNMSNLPKGKIMELIEIPLHADYPQETAGGGIGPWIENEHAINIQDMDMVAGIHDVSQGRAPQGITAFAAMALLAEQDERRIGPVLKTVRATIADQLLISLDLVRKYWPDGKHLAVAGPEGRIESMMYQNAKLPEQFYFDISKQTPLPKSPAIESQKIFDLFHAAIASGTPLPPEWLKDSLDQGRALPFPKREEMVQQRNAEYENYLIEQGVPVSPKYFDDDFIHVQIHRHAQVSQAATPGTEQYAQALEMHIMMHLEQAQLKKPGMSSGSAGAVPSAGAIPAQQGGHGIEAQSGAANLQGLAQNINGPPPASQGGAVRAPQQRPG